MSASQVRPSAGSGQSKPHAGVTLDVRAIDNAALHDPESRHVEVEPIPWKTGDVGAVKPIDRETTWIPKASTAGLRKSVAVARTDVVNGPGCRSHTQLQVQQVAVFGQSFNPKRDRGESAAGRSDRLGAIRVGNSPYACGLDWL